MIRHYNKIKIFGLIIYLTSGMLIGMEHSNGKFIAKIESRHMCGTTPTWHQVSIKDKSGTELKRIKSKAPVINIYWNGNILYVKREGKNTISIDMNKEHSQLKCQ